MENIDESRYGEVKAFYKTWGDPNNPGSHWSEVKSRPCTKQELLLEEGNGPVKFAPYDKSIQADISKYANRLMCIEDDIEIFGSFSSNKV